ncbi:LOB domain-containing protein 20-like [Trifolium pratense]|uniref:LOB domain-containing protein 20-like n=1 Tax=Trifolium pratense TaxID=57577 RepID=UPI001E6932C2|nr:LOB domain-containing protein 20-like [Trifolium pratense]
MAESQGGDVSSGTRRKQGAASFAAVHKVFDANNVSKLLSNVSTNHHHEAVATISYEAQTRLSDQVYGYVSTILALQQQVAAKAEISMMETELMKRGFTCENALQTTPQQQPQMLHQPNFNVAVQPVYSNNSYGCTNTS